MRRLVVLLLALAASTPAFAERNRAASAADRLSLTLQQIAQDANHEARLTSGRGDDYRARRLDRYALISQQIAGTLQGRIVWALRDGVDMRSVRNRYARMQPKFQDWNYAYGDVTAMPNTIRNRVLLAKRLYAQVRAELNDNF